MKRKIHSCGRMPACSRFTHHVSRVTFHASRITLLFLAVYLSQPDKAFPAEPVDTSKLPPPSKATVDFDQDVRPILEKSCFRCHGPERPRSHFRLDQRDEALKGGDNGVDIVPGDSSKSPLVHYVAGLVEDMQMPPPGKGDRLTPLQIGVLRAWIDQGASWSQTNVGAQVAASAVTSFRWIGVNGDSHKFREIEGIKEGAGGGIDHFSISEAIGPDKTFSVEGRVLFPDDDIQVKLTLRKRDFGFVNAGFEQWRRYYDDTGGYYQPLPQPSYNLGRDLYLDIGRAWIDFGLTLPEIPKIVLGYEYAYQNGSKSTLEWGAVSGKTIYPSALDIDEHTHILKLDLSYDFLGWSLQDNARVEFYSNTTKDQNVENPLTLFPVQGTINTREGATHTQGQNTIHVERQIMDGVLVSAGYLYSKIDGDASLNQTTVDAAGQPVAGLFWSSDEITLKRETHTFSLSGLLKPWDCLTVSLGVQPEWTREEGFGKLHLDEGDPNALVPPFWFLETNTLQSDLDTTKVSEEAGLRFTRIPWTVLFAEARFDQEQIGQSEQQIGDEVLLGGSEFQRQTDFSNEHYDYRAGFTTSPWTRLSLNAYYRRRLSDSDYDNHKIQPPDYEGYSAFITGRRIDTDEGEVRLAWRAANWIKLAVTYQIVATDYKTSTEPVSGFDPSVGMIVPGFITPGGTVNAGNYDAQVYGFSASVTPLQRLYFSGNFTYSESRTATAQNGDPSIMPYKGNIISVLFNANYRLNARTDFQALYSFSRADYGQDNVAYGLPLGLNYSHNRLAVGVSRRLNDRATVGLRYTFFQYSEPSTGGFNNYTANGVFATLSLKLP